LVSRDGQQEKQYVLHRFIQITQVKEQGNERHHDSDATYRGQNPRQVKREPGEDHVLCKNLDF